MIAGICPSESEYFSRIQGALPYCCEPRTRIQWIMCPEFQIEAQGCRPNFAAKELSALWKREIQLTVVKVYWLLWKGGRVDTA
jgi:hypothetical protein